MTFVRICAGVTVVVLTLGLVWLIGMRTKLSPVIDFQRRVNRRLVNPRQMRTAGTEGSYAGVVRHTGRESGRQYETPVVPLPTSDGFVILLVYGARSHWVRNVLAAGTATIVYEGETCDVVEPEIIPVAEAGREFSARERREMWVFGNKTCLRLRRAGPPSGP
ncbi:MAG: nitroreductase family deazaflavin-dependent oxidoreductase [Acidimicrobiia bacterium]|nr:nitroreductase family deazaflavin-dependent oxidoreductase [Acidimicrobiia bacterium]